MRMTEPRASVDAERRVLAAREARECRSRLAAVTDALGANMDIAARCEVRGREDGGGRIVAVERCREERLVAGSLTVRLDPERVVDRVLDDEREPAAAVERLPRI